MADEGGRRGGRWPRAGQAAFPFPRTGWGGEPRPGPVGRPSQTAWHQSPPLGLPMPLLPLHQARLLLDPARLRCAPPVDSTRLDFTRHLAGTA